MIQETENCRMAGEVEAGVNHPSQPAIFPSLEPFRITAHLFLQFLQFGFKEIG